MKISYFFSLVLPALLLSTGCVSEPANSESTKLKDNEIDARETPAPVDAVQTDDKDNHGAEKNQEDSSLLADGSHTVFGLKMPGGMIPITTPDKDVARFEGTHELQVLKRYILSQIRTSNEIEKEGETGFLVRQARLIKPEEGAKPDLRLAIRIFNGSLGGGSVDVWKEKEPVASGEDLRVPTALPNYKVAPSSQPDATGVQGLVVGSDKTREQQMMHIMDKLEKGEKLTPEELESPYFH